MRTIISRKNLDQKIKKCIQAVEQEVPPQVETAFMAKLHQAIPHRPPRRSGIYWGVLAAAATLLLVILFFLFPLFHQQIDPVEAEEVWVQAACVEGQPATTYVINEKDPDITIVWIEKINPEKGGKQ